MVASQMLRTLRFSNLMNIYDPNMTCVCGYEKPSETDHTVREGKMKKGGT